MKSLLIFSFAVFDSVQDNTREGTIIMVEFDRTKIFAYVTGKNRVSSNRAPTVYITFESTSSHLSDKLQMNMHVCLRTIAYIRTEIFKFDAIYNLKKSTLCDMILNPTLIRPLTLERRNYVYKGHVSKK